MGIFGWTARSGVSTMPATFAYRSACEEYSHANNRFLSVAHLRSTCHERTLLFKQTSAQSTHCWTSTECTGTQSWRLEVDELPVTHCLWRWTKHLRKKLMVEDVKHEATAVLGPVHSSHSWYVRLMNFQAPEAKTFSVKYPVSWDTIHSGCLAKLQTHETGRETLDVYPVDKSARLLKIGNEYPHASTNYTLQQVQELVHNMLQTCDRRQNGVRQSK